MRQSFHHAWVNTTHRKVQPVLRAPQPVNTHTHTRAKRHPWETQPQHKHLLCHQHPHKQQFGGGWFQLFTINLGNNPSDQLPTASSGETHSLITITNVVCVCVCQNRFCALVYVCVYLRVFQFRTLCAHLKTLSPNLNFNAPRYEAEFRNLHNINILCPLICFEIAFP